MSENPFTQFDVKLPDWALEMVKETARKQIEEHMRKRRQLKAEKIVSRLRTDPMLTQTPWNLGERTRIVRARSSGRTGWLGC